MPEEERSDGAGRDDLAEVLRRCEVEELIASTLASATAHAASDRGHHLVDVWQESGGRESNSRHQLGRLRLYH